VRALRDKLAAAFDARDRAERIQVWATLVLQLAIAAVLASALWEARWLLAFTAAVVLSLTFLPATIERSFSLQLPVELTLLNALFLYAAFGLGEVRRFYQRFWWWDLLLHSLSAFLIGLVGFLLVHTFLRTRRIRAAPFYVALVSFGFAMTLGTLWEVFEYLMDWGFGFNMQKSGLDDTMTDLIVNTAGAALAAWFGYRYVKGGDSHIADRVIRRFLAKNPHLFRSD